MCEDLSFADGRFKCVKRCPPGLDLSADGLCVGEWTANRACQQLSYNAIFHRNFQKYSVKDYI